MKNIFEEAKKFLSVSPNGYDDAYAETEQVEAEPEYEEVPRRREPRIFQAEKKGKNASVSEAPQMRVVLVRPDNFNDAAAIADHLKQGKNVIVNLELANRELARRLIDFLQGAACMADATIRRVSNSTYMVAVRSTELSGDSLFDEFSDGDIY